MTRKRLQDKKRAKKAPSPAEAGVKAAQDAFKKILGQADAEPKEKTSSKGR